MNIDLTGQTEIRHEYSFDENTGLTTITFKDSGDVVLGTVLIETVRYPKLMQTMDIIAEESFSDIDPQVKPRTTFDRRGNLAISKYD